MAGFINVVSVGVVRNLFIFMRRQMTDKQMAEKKKQFVLDTNSLLEKELTENDLDIIFEWFTKLTEEVERETEEDLIGEYPSFGMREDN